jgi:aminoglycoside phosphotransferase (APT) family kinase protein
VATGTQRDPATLRAGLDRWLAAHPDRLPGRTDDGGAPTIIELTHAEGGMSNETLLIDFGPGHDGIVVRLPPVSASLLDYDLGPQALVQNAVAAAGVPAPAPALVEREAEWIGTPFMVMPRVGGRIPGPAPLFDEWLMGLEPPDQRHLHDGLIDTLADIHAIDWASAGLATAYEESSLLAALEHWTAYVEWSAEDDPLPALVEALSWCRRHCPPEAADPPVLLWGDVRLGNLIYDDQLAVRAVLDWDLASLGQREMDLGWYFGLDFMMDQLFERRVPGFPSRDESLARYEARSGHVVAHLDWHEVFALARALAIIDRHQRIAGSRRRTENPMGPILLARIEAADT